MRVALRNQPPGLMAILPRGARIAFEENGVEVAEALREDGCRTRRSGSVPLAGGTGCSHRTRRS
jgi:hypothetical protein